MITPHMLQLAGLLLTVVGTAFLWVDSVRIARRMPPDGIVLGEHPSARHWLFQRAATIGFSLMFIGTTLQFASAW